MGSLPEASFRSSHEMACKTRGIVKGRCQRGESKSPVQMLARYPRTLEAPNSFGRGEGWPIMSYYMARSTYGTLTIRIQYSVTQGTTTCATMSSPSSKPVLLDFCHEILHEILINLPPTDIASVSRTCKSLHSYIAGNRLLWRDLYLNQFVCVNFTICSIATLLRIS